MRVMFLSTTRLPCGKMERCSLRCLPVSWFTIRTTKEVFVLHLQNSQKVPRSQTCPVFLCLTCHMPIEGIQDIRISICFSIPNREEGKILRSTSHHQMRTPGYSDLYEVQSLFKPERPLLLECSMKNRRRNINDTTTPLPSFTTKNRCPNSWKSLDPLWTTGMNQFTVSTVFYIPSLKLT